MDLGGAEGDMSESREGSGHRRLVRNLVLLRKTMMVLLRERQWQSGLDSTAEMKQRLEHILEVELIEPTGGLQAGLGKMLRSRIKNVLTYSIQQLDLCSCHLLRC